MQIVIDIPKEYYKAITEIPNHQCTADMLIIKNGTPLPKGHGRLIDADKLKENYPHDTDWEYPVNTNQYVCDTIDALDTIIEADKGE